MVIKICFAVMLLCTVAIIASTLWLEWKLNRINRDYKEWRDKKC